MTSASGRPDLRRIGQSAFLEVLSVLLSLPATVQNPSSHADLSNAPDQVTSMVPLAGQRLSGRVHLQLPLAFVARAVWILTGLDHAEGEANGVLEDTAGELSNMVAGRVAVQLAADGYPCTLGTPSVSRNVTLPMETELGMDFGRIDLFCDGHWLSLELKCRYAIP